MVYVTVTVEGGLDDVMKCIKLMAVGGVDSGADRFKKRGMRSRRRLMPSKR